MNLKNPARPVKVGLGTDLGAGTSFSILQTLNEAYKAAQMNSQPYTSLHGFYLATRGGAEALGVEDKIGSIEVGKEADLAVINMKSTPIIDYRMRYAESLEEALFIQMTLGDDRAIAATYVAGSKVYSAQN
jgi:guanine deaminase